MAYLANLPPGTKFRVKSKYLNMTGTLLKVNQCRARVKLDGVPDRVVSFTDKWGGEHEFIAPSRGAIRDWSPGTEVIVLELGKWEEPAQPEQELDPDYLKDTDTSEPLGEPEPEQEKEWFDD